MDYMTKVWAVLSVLFSGFGIFLLQRFFPENSFSTFFSKFSRTPATRRSLKASIEPYFIENKEIFDVYGPMTDERYNPESEFPAIWRRKIQEFILPNNKKIVALIERDMHLLETWELEVFMRYKQHVNDFSAKHTGLSLAGGLVFPPEIRTILE